MTLKLTQVALLCSAALMLGGCSFGKSDNECEVCTPCPECEEDDSGSQTPPLTEPEISTEKTFNETLVLADASEATVTVTTVAAFIEAIKDAKPGDVIALADGDYELGELSISASVIGTAAQPITLRAENEGQVVFTSSVDTPTMLTINGDYVHVRGFVWQDPTPSTSSSDGAVILKGNHNHFINNTMVGSGYGYDENCDPQDIKWVTLDGQDHVVSHNRFEGKCGKGVLLTVKRTIEREDRHHIHHNIFKDYVPNWDDDNGFETLRIGTSKDSQYDSSSVVEYNLFERTNGEIEVISNKSGNNTYRYNTLRNSDGLLTIRHGKNATIEYNVFLQSGSNAGGGIRMFDSSHTVRHNYIEGVDTSSNSRGGIVIHAGINAQGSGDPEGDALLNKQWTANTLTIENNTIYESRQGIFHNAYMGSSNCNGESGSVDCQSAWGVSFNNNVVHAEGTSEGVAVTLGAGTLVADGRYQNEYYYGRQGTGFEGSDFDSDSNIITAKQTFTQSTNANTKGLWQPSTTAAGAGADFNQLLVLEEDDAFLGPNYRYLPSSN